MLPRCHDTPPSGRLRQRLINIPYLTRTQLNGHAEVCQLIINLTKFYRIVSIAL